MHDIFAKKKETTMYNYSEQIKEVVESLTSDESLEKVFHKVHEGVPLPSNDALREIVTLAREVLFPGYFGQSKVISASIGFHMGVNIEKLFRMMKKQVMAGLCFCMEPGDDSLCIDDIRQKAIEITEQVIRKLPDIRKVLSTDVEAAFNGDPAATSFGEIIACYPVIRTLTNYRLAHELHLLGVPLIPRMITELAHSETGIDIHPAAKIGHHFTIDHGTGVVIGATCIIGNNVKLYQGVTLGALSFPLDKDGNPIKGIARHPILEDDVIVYSNATILGRITIGKGSVIGANKWVTDNVATGSKIYKNVKIQNGFENGNGI